MTSLKRVLLSNPTVVSLTTGEESSWIQLARCGTFVSNRYGKFSITKTDLAQMLANYREVTPKAPTELPIDWDHLSMDPKKPGDGAAAGWMKELELRDQGETLWARVAWTPRGAEAIHNKEYRFVSPSFVKDHVHKDGKKIGTTLLAAAITNHPFLESMAALSLYNCDSLPLLDFSKPETRMVSAHEALNLTDANGGTGTQAGQRVMIAPGNARTQDEIGATFEIAEVVGDGDDAFVSLKDANGMIHKWFRATELLPASSTPANPQHPGLVPGAMPTVPAQSPLAAVPGAQGTAPAAPNPQAVVNPTDPNTPKSDAAAKEAIPGIPSPLAATAKAKVAGAEEKSDEGGTGAEAKPGADAKAANPFGKKKAGKEGDDGSGGDPAKVAAADAPRATVPGSITAQAPGAAAAVSTDLPLPDELKKALAAAMAAANPQQKGINMKFTLNNDKGEPIEITDAQLEAAGVKVVPEGSVAVPTTELAGMKAEVTSLSSRLDASEKLRVATEFEAEIERLKKGALITGAQEAFARSTWGGSIDLTAFKAWAGTFVTPLMSLNKEHGSGGKADPAKTSGEQATDKLLTLSRDIAKERGISLSDATKLAGAQLATEAEQYREQFADA